MLVRHVFIDLPGQQATPWFALAKSVAWPSKRDHLTCEQTDIMNIGGFSDAVFSSFLADKTQRFVAEVEAIEL